MRIARYLTLLMLVVMAQSVPAQQEIGNFCVQDYQADAVCSANDVRVEQLVPVIIESCVQGTIGEAEVQFGMHVSAAGSPNRWDIGIFIGLGGGLNEALEGDNCLHDFLDPPLTTTPTYSDVEPSGANGVDEIIDGPWFENDGDNCGDIRDNSEIFKNLATQVTVICVDRDNDGFADVHACVSWDNNASSTCDDVQTAFPSTPSKCGCAVIDLGIMPIPVTLQRYSVD